MTLCPNPDCTWKFDGNTCPKCGTGAENSTERRSNKKVVSTPVYQSNTKQHARIRPRKKNWVSLAQAMRDYVKSRYPNKPLGRQIPCDNCGGIIRQIKYENVSHWESRGAHPSKARDFDNYAILCGPTDFWGQVDRSCHTLWGEGKDEAFENKKGSRLGERLPP